jgi:protein SCO1
MKNRREMLAAGALALPALALSARGATLLGPQADAGCKAPGSGPMSEYFPNVTVLTHRNERALLYDDLLRGKIVTLNFISTRDEAAHRVTENLVKVQRLLGDRVGRDVFMYSITTAPEHDTPKVLRAFAEENGVGPGWLFLTGSPEVMQGLLSRIFVGSHQHAAAGHAGGNCSRGLARYGNLVTGSFGSFPAMARPESIAERFTGVGFGDRDQVSQKGALR